MRLNDFLLVDFNKILRSEENALHKAGFDNLSISEAHTLAGLQALTGEKPGEAGGEGVSMSSIAEHMGVTTGTMTVAIRTLECKGYVFRRRGKPDLRVVRVYLTEQGRAAIAWHAAFHRGLAHVLQSNLNQGELTALDRALDLIVRYYHGQAGSGEFPEEERNLSFHPARS